MPLLQVRGLTKTVPGKMLFEDINFMIRKGQTIGLVASNGAGKSTLAKILVGQEDADEGEVLIDPSVDVGYLPQVEEFDKDALVADVLFSHDSEIGQLIKQYEQALRSTHQSEDVDITALVQKIDALQGWEYETRVSIVINMLHLQDLLDQRIATCSGGELKRIALAKALVFPCDVMILDEPTNHLDVEMIEWLQSYLKREVPTMLLITHDRYFLEELCDSIFELDAGTLHTYPGNYSKYLERKEHRLAVEKSKHHKLKQSLKKELAWMRKQARARETKSVLRTKKFLAVEQQYKKAKLHEHNRDATMELSLMEKRVGGTILSIRNIQKSFGEKCIVKDFSYTFRQRERVGIIGNNGVGKSTFIDLILGKIEKDAGKVKWGETITKALYQQKQDPIDESKKVIDVVKDVAEYILVGEGKQLSASHLLERFLFSPQKQHQRAYTLSGGEKRRLHLLKTLITNPNFLILDEPTNDLDIDTLAILEDFLLSFKGCLIIISHDRFFMDRVVDHLFVFEGGGVINEYPGSYADRKASQKSQKETTSGEKDDGHQRNQQQQTQQLLVDNAKRKKSLSNKEREEYTRLGQEIERLEYEKEEINNAFAQGTLDHGAIKEQSKRLAQVVALLQEYETRWFALAERK